MRKARRHSGTHARRAKAAALAAALALASTAAAQTLEYVTFTRGGAIIPPSGSSYTHVVVLGQPIAGLAGAANPVAIPGPSYNLQLTFGVGFVMCLRKPTNDLSTTLIEWVWEGEPFDERYTIPENWEPPVVLPPFFPNNSGSARYHVRVRPQPGDPTPTVVLDITPRIARLTLESASTIEVSSESASDAGITFSGFGGPTEQINAVSTGVVQIDCTDNLSDDFLISGMHLDQTGGGVLRAKGTQPGTLRLVNCKVLGGTLESTGSSRIEVYDSVIVSPVVQGPSGVSIGQDGNNPLIYEEATALGTINTATQIRIESGANLIATSANASFTGAGAVLLTSATASTLGGSQGFFTNGLAPGAAHRIEGRGLVAGSLLNNGIIDANDVGELKIDIPESQNPTEYPIIPNFATRIVNNAVNPAQRGIMRATNGGTLRIASPLHNLGVIRAESNSSVFIDDVVTGTGDLSMGGGSFHINIVHSGGFTAGDIDVRPGSTSTFIVTGTNGTCDDFSLEGGTATLERRVDVPTVLHAAGAVTMCPDTGFDPAAVAVLNVDGSTLTAGSIHVCVGPGVNPPGGGALHVLNGGGVTCAGAFSFDAVDEADLAFDPQTTLRMTGGVGQPDNDPANYAALEVGGEDLGTNPALHIGDVAGFANNFDLDELEIGAGARVKLIDAHDNGNRSDNGYGPREALYVRKLTFADAAGRLNIRGLHLYYQDLSAPNGTAQITGFITADSNCDGTVDFFDIDPFLIALFNAAQYAAMYPNCDLFAADADQDGSVDFFDIDPFLDALFN